MAIDRCEQCGTWNMARTEKCPECGSIVDVDIDGACLSWVCRNCAFAAATTATKLCRSDAGDYSKESYSKLDSCPYAEAIS